MQTLQQAGLEVKYHDPYVPEWSIERINELDELIVWADIVVLVTGHDCYKSLNTSDTLIDTCGLLRSN